MARKEIKAIFNDNELNKMNSNFKELYDEFGNVVDTVTEKAFDKVVDSAKINWGEPVDTFGDLPSDASNSETRMTRDDGKIYRFDGSIWREIQDIDPTAINEVDSRLSASLADKTTYDYVDMLISNIVSGAPQGTFATLEALETEYPSGTEGVFLVLENDSNASHVYFWNGTKWEDAGAYQADGLASIMTVEDEPWEVV